TVETDGSRVVSVSDGILRVVDARSHEVTGRLDLTMYAGAGSAQLLLAGDRLLVILGDPTPNVYGGPIYSRPYPTGGARTSLFLLVDLAGPLSVISTLHPHGGYVDARMVDGTARLVVSSTPTIAFPAARGSDSDGQRLARNREIVARAPLTAWLPTYEVTTGTTTAAHTVPCTAVSHPKTYTGASMLTVYTVHLADGLDQPEPITIAADGTEVYGSTKSLYVASSDGNRTHLHHFDTSGPGRPTYLGSATVPGQLFDSYSMSQYDNSLRVVTTSYTDDQTTSLRVLDEATLRITGMVGRLGAGERLHAVRFLGPLAYVVTFRSVDPLYVLDLHDPTHPRRSAELTMTGYSDYLHPVGPGRLLGVGESVNSNGIVNGLQISLFDSSSAQHTRRLAHLTRANTPSESPIDPHAFLYWPAAKLAILPINSWNGNESGAALVVRVGDIGLRTVGTIRNPAVSTTDGYDSGITRTLVIGDDIWTMSSSGMQVSDLTTLDRRAWVLFT
ncbi:MAG: beta-propeller domain-containing protein, partial [Jatrophihabitans sp.]|uniref:beta-propeller domain-containing protein n=1 Tax=Jatrophihabitans sp. TaxID=1932789 RepID=UPI00390F56DB